MGEIHRKQFIFYSSYYDEISKIKSKSKQLFAFEVICRYALYGEEPDVCNLPKCVASVFQKCRPILDFERRQSIEGRRSSEYKKWRNSVFERDDYTCQNCGCRGIKLNAHHIKEYAFFPELRFDVENGVTLCVTCHKAAHRRVRHG